MIQLTKQQADKIRPVLSNFDELITQGNKEQFLRWLDIAIVGMLDEKYNSTEKSRKYQRIYDDILYNTPDDGEV
jgi:hypothetical protein